MVYGRDASRVAEVDSDALIETTQTLGISDHSTDATTVYIDPKNRIQTFGTHYPNWLGKLRFPGVLEIQESKGDVVRISTRVKGVPRTSEQINRTLVHELEHVAQHDRNDKKLTQGHIAIWGLAIAGAILGHKLGKGKVAKLSGTLVGAGVGHSVGYMIAPHERQARNRAKEVESRAIVIKSHA